MVGRKRKNEKSQQGNQEKAEKLEFSWSDDEIQLLLMSSLDFKAQCEFEGTDWESVRSKYEKIFDIMMKGYPEGEQYQNKRSMTKDRVTAKLKNIRTGFKKAADAGRRSGGGRVVFTFYDLCINLWGGSPSVTSIVCGLDTSQQEQEESDNSIDDISNAPASPTFPQQQRNTDTVDEVQVNETMTATVVSVPNKKIKEKKEELEKLNQKAVERRKTVKEMLTNRKDKKMTQALSSEKQIIQISQEDVALKREILDKMNQNDQEFRTNFMELNKTMSTIGNAIQQSVGLLSQLVNQGLQPAREIPRYNGFYTQQVESLDNMNNEKENTSYQNL